MLVEFKKANICQTEGENVLEGVDFQVDESDFIYLIGRVGSGKSSLLKTIYCELDIDEAEDVTLDFGIMIVPTMIVFKNGKEFDRMIGAQPKAAILDFVK